MMINIGSVMINVGFIKSSFNFLGREPHGPFIFILWKIITLLCYISHSRYTKRTKVRIVSLITTLKVDVIVKNFKYRGTVRSIIDQTSALIAPARVFGI